MATTTVPVGMPKTTPSTKGISWPFPVDFLRNHTIDEILTCRMTNRTSADANYELDEMEDTETIETAFKKLRTGDVNALPLYHKDGDKKVYKAMVDAMSLAAYTIFQAVWDELENKQFSKKEQKAEIAYKKSLLEKIKKHMDEYFKRPAEDALGFEYVTFQFHQLPRTGSVLDLVKIMKNGIHHVFIPASKDQPADIVSEGDLALWLTDPRIDDPALNQLWKMGADAAATYGLHFKPGADPNQLEYPNNRWTGGNRRMAIRTTDDVSAIVAFKMMMIHHVSSLAIVSPKTGELQGNLSASDIRFIDQTNIDRLLLPVMEYLSLIPDRPQAAITITRHATIQQALNKCVKNNVHRVWEIDEHKRPIGAFSVTDAICCLLPTEEPK